MEERERKRIIRQKLLLVDEKRGRRPAPPIPTRFPALDAALGVGGLSRGSVVEIFGPASSGKSTLALQIVAHAIEDGLSAAWIDAERAFDPPQAARLGVPVERLPIARPDSAEQALEIARRLLNSAAVDLLVIDSAAALVPRLELETALGTAAASLHSRVLASGLRTLAAAALRWDAVVLVLNQTRSRRGASDEETSAGGPPLKLHAALRISMDAARGGFVPFRVVKNKAASAFAVGKFRWENGWKFAESP